VGDIRDFISGLVMQGSMEVEAQDVVMTTFIGVLEATIEVWIVVPVMGNSDPGTGRLMQGHDSIRCRVLVGHGVINRKGNVQW
jgi:hypothetical protein